MSVLDINHAYLVGKRVRYNGIIRIIRGDTQEFTLVLQTGDRLNPESYEVTKEDSFYFGITEPNKIFQDSIVKKVYDINNFEFDDQNNLVIRLNPNDTNYLLPGTYYYSIKAVTKRANEADIITTLIPATLFDIM